MYLPALQAVDGTDLGVALVNSDSTDAQVTLTVRTYEGQLIGGTTNPYNLTVPASGKLELRLADLFGSGISVQHGWLQITPSTAAVKAFSFVFDSDLTFVEGVGMTSDTSDQLVFQKISAQSDTNVHVVNTSAAPVEATISLYDNTGNLAGVSPASLSGYSGFTRNVSDLVQAGGFEGYAIVQTAGNVFAAPSTLIGFETYRNNSDLAAIRGVPVSARITNGYWSHFATQSGYTSRLTLINTADTPQTLRITASGMPGSITVTQTLAPHQRIEKSVADIFGLAGSALIEGNVGFETETGAPGIAAMMEYGTVDGASLSASEPQNAPQSDFYFTHLAEGSGYYTGLAFLNPNADTSTLLLDLFDKSGLVTASTVVDLNSGERKVGLIDLFFQTAINQIGGYIRASSEEPVFAQEILGSTGPTAFLANVPAQTDAVTTQYSAAATTNPPVITSISPSKAVIDKLVSLNVRVSGSGFTRNSVVSYDGVKMRTSFLKSVLLAITISGSGLTPGVHYLQVSNPTTGRLSNIAKLLLASGTFPANQPPVVNAGSNQTITLPSVATLSGTVSDDGLPLTGTLSSTWSTVSGPGTVTFANASSPVTTASFSTNGIYTLRLTASDGALSSTSNVTITVNPASVSVLSSVTALSLDKTTVSPGQTLNASIIYQNTSSSAMTINQIAITARPPGGTNSAGPYDDFSPLLGATTIQAGAKLQVSASRAFTSSDPTGAWYAFATYQDSSLVWHDGPSVNFTVSAPTPISQPPVVNAGPNQTITLPASANLNGTVTGSGLQPGTLTTTWSKSNGPGTVTFGNVNALSTTASFSTAGTYVLLLTASQGALTSTSSVTVVVNLAVVVTPPVTSSGPAYYVSNIGNDSNSGTSQSSPWKTIAKVQSFLPNLQPGDSVLFQRGGIWSEELDVNNVNGTSGSPITFSNYGTGNLPIIDGGGTVSGNTVNGGRQWCIGGSTSKMSYITIDGFECRNTSSYGIAFIDVASGSVGIVVQNSYIHDTGNGDTGYHNQLMFAEYNFGHAYGTKFLNNKVGNCYGHNCIQIHGDTGSPLIQGNECYGFSHNCIDVKYVQGVVVDRNVVHDGLGTQQFENAYYIENSATSYTGDVTWTRNVVYGTNITSAFQCQGTGGAVACRVYNNTVYSGATGVFGGSDTGNFSVLQIDVKNNIFDITTPKGGGGNVTWDYNDNVQGSPIGPHDLHADPLFVNAAAHDFHLQPGSPVVDKGVNVSLPFAGSAPDLGAFEFGLP